MNHRDPHTGNAVVLPDNTQCPLCGVWWAVHDGWSCIAGLIEEQEPHTRQAERMVSVQRSPGAVLHDLVGPLLRDPYRDDRIRVPLLDLPQIPPTAWGSEAKANHLRRMADEATAYDAATGRIS